MNKRIKYGVLALVCAQACMMPTQAQAKWSNRQIATVGTMAVAAAATAASTCYLTYKQWSYAKDTCKKIDKLREKAELKEFKPEKALLNRLLATEPRHCLLYNALPNIATEDMESRSNDLKRSLQTMIDRSDFDIRELNTQLKARSKAPRSALAAPLERSESNSESESSEFRAKSDFKRAINYLSNKEYKLLAEYRKELDKLVPNTAKAMCKLIAEADKDKVNVDQRIKDEVARLRQTPEDENALYASPMKELWIRVKTQCKRLYQGIGIGCFSRTYRADALQLCYDLYKKQQRLDAIKDAVFGTVDAE